MMSSYRCNSPIGHGSLRAPRWCLAQLAVEVLRWRALAKYTRPYPATPQAWPQEAKIDLEGLPETS